MLTLRHWRRSEYERLVELGVFAGEPIELIGGQLIVAEPQSAYHAAAVGAAQEALRAALPPGWIVRAQMPIALDDESTPEPDLAVVPGTHADYLRAHPSEAALVVEVAVTSLVLDRLHKGSVYARAGIRDYWIANLVDGRLEVYRDPRRDRRAPYGWGYRAAQQLRPSDVAVSLVLPALRIPVAALVPPGPNRTNDPPGTRSRHR